MLTNTAAQKILVFSPAWVGDIVMSQVLLRLLKQQYPHCTIDIMTQQWAEPLLQRMPEVHQIHTMTFKHGELALHERWRLGVKLRREKYTHAIVLQNSWKSALPAFAARIPLRTSWLGEWRFGLLNDIRHLDKQKLPLMIQRFAMLGLPAKKELPEILPPPLLQINAELRAQTLSKFNLMADKPILALCPGAEYGSAKRWPVEHYAEIAKQKIAAGWNVWLFGGPKDQVLAAEIQCALNDAAVDLTGKTTLGEAVDLLSLARIVVSNDSGLMHVAAALHRPLIAIYGSSSPGFTPPLNEQAKILSLKLSCSPCFKRECPLQHLNCLKNLLPQQVLATMDTMLA